MEILAIQFLKRVRMHLINIMAFETMPRLANPYDYARQNTAEIAMDIIDDCIRELNEMD